MTQKKSKINTTIIPEVIENKILFVRGQKVMLDKDLAELYGVETKVLNQAVRRNSMRFPEDFVFQLTKTELKGYESLFKDATNSRSQIVTLKRGQNTKYLPHAFTEHGILMLSSVLKSKRAVQVNIEIVRTFTRLRKMVAGHKELKQKIEALERKYDHQFKVVFEAIRRLIELPEKPKRPIGFHSRG